MPRYTLKQTATASFERAGQRTRVGAAAAGPGVAVDRGRAHPRRAKLGIDARALLSDTRTKVAA